MKVLTGCMLASVGLLFTVVGGGADEAHGVDSLVAPYGKIHAALVAEDLEAAKQAAFALAENAKAAETVALEKETRVLADSKDLAEARERFKTVSKELMAFVQGEKGYYIGSCPMAHAVWIQTDRKVRNPYMGKAMLACGDLRPTGGGPSPGGAGTVSHGEDHSGSHPGSCH